MQSAIIKTVVCRLSLVAGGVTSLGRAAMTGIRTIPSVDGGRRRLDDRDEPRRFQRSILGSAVVAHLRCRLDRGGYEPLDGEIQGVPSNARMVGMLLTAGLLYLFKGPIALPSQLDLTLRPADSSIAGKRSDVSEYPVLR